MKCIKNLARPLLLDFAGAFKKNLQEKPFKKVQEKGREKITTCSSYLLTLRLPHHPEHPHKLCRGMSDDCGTHRAEVQTCTCSAL